MVRNGQINEELYQTIITKTSRIRGLPPLAPIYADLKTKASLRDYLIQEFQQEYSDEKAQKLQKTYQTIGLIPENVDFKAELLRLYEEEIAGFYEPKLKKLFLVEDSISPGFWIGLLQLLLQRDLVGEMLLSHEYTHALQDQYFDLNRMQEETKDDDQSLALGCLIEGDATASSLDTLFSQAHSETTPEIFDETDGHIMQQLMLFKYLGGLRFVREQLKKGGYSYLNTLFENPPRSTEQILHPEKYPNELPDAVSLESMLNNIEAEYELLEENVFGEYVLRQYLNLHLSLEQSKKMAEGWNGDRYAVYEKGNHRIFLWKTHWDTSEDAQEFFEGYRQFLLKKFPKAQSDENTRSNICFSSPEGFHSISLQGREVHIAERLSKSQARQWTP